MKSYWDIRFQNELTCTHCHSTEPIAFLKTNDFFLIVMDVFQWSTCSYIFNFFDEFQYKFGLIKYLNVFLRIIFHKSKKFH